MPPGRILQMELSEPDGVDVAEELAGTAPASA